MSLEIQRYNWKAYRAKEHPHKIQNAIMDLKNTSSQDDAKIAYWKIDSVAVFQGYLFEVAVPTATCLLSVLQRCEVVGRIYILELLVQLGSGEPDPSELEVGNSSLNKLVLHEISLGAAIYFDILEYGTEEEKNFCVDLLGFCCEYDNSLKSRVTWWFNHLLSVELSSGSRKLIENWLSELK